MNKSLSNSFAHTCVNCVDKWVYGSQHIFYDSLAYRTLSAGHRATEQKCQHLESKGTFVAELIYFNLVKKSSFDSTKILVTVQGCGAFVVFQMDFNVNGFSWLILYDLKWFNWHLLNASTYSWLIVCRSRFFHPKQYLMDRNSHLRLFFPMSESNIIDIMK